MANIAFEVVPATLAETGTLLPILRDAEEGEERIRAALLDPACVAYAARNGGELLGATVVRWESTRTGEILYIAVRADVRGQGYGKLMLKALQTEAVGRGASALLVGTANSSLENIAFYQKCGFRMFAVKRDYFTYIQPPLQEHGIMMRDMLLFSYEQKDTFL